MSAEEELKIKKLRFNLYKFLVFLFVATLLAGRYFDPVTVEAMQIFLLGFIGLAIIFETANYLERKKKKKLENEKENNSDHDDEGPGIPVDFYREKDILGNDKPQ